MVMVDKDILIQGLTSLLDDLSHIKTITIGKWVLHVLSLMELNELPCPMSNTIKFLKLRSDFTTDDVTGIACLLRKLNHLEKLVIEIRYNDVPLFVPFFSKQDLVCLKNKGYSLSDILKNLKNVEILGLREDQGVRFPDDLNVRLPNDLNNIRLFVEFLLKKAKFLENMIITVRGSTRYIMELK